MACGCAGAKMQKPGLRDIDLATKETEMSPAETIQVYDQRRAEALYQAACTRWQDGDATTCEQNLVKLLEFQPNHRAGRLMLADLFLATGRTPAAEQLLEQLLATNPNDAQVHHSMGLLYDSIGRADKSLSHLEKSVQLAPENKLYSLTCEAIRVTKD